MEPVLGLADSVPGSADDDREAVPYVFVAQVVDAERAGFAVDKHDVVDAEGLL